MDNKAEYFKMTSWKNHNRSLLSSFKSQNLGLGNFITYNISSAIKLKDYVRHAFSQSNLHHIRKFDLNKYHVQFINLWASKTLYDFNECVFALKKDSCASTQSLKHYVDIRNGVIAQCLQPLLLELRRFDFLYLKACAIHSLSFFFSPHFHFNF